MFPFRPNRKYRTIALYVGCTCAVAMVIVMLIFRMGTIVQIFRSFFNTLLPVLYGLLFAYFCAPLLRFYEKKVFGKLYMARIGEAEAMLDGENHEAARKTIHTLRTRRRLLCLFMTYFSLLLILVLFGLLIIPQISGEYVHLTEKISEYMEKLFAFIASVFEKTGGFLKADNAATFLQGALASIFSYGATAISNIVLAPYRIFLGIFISFYVLMRKERTMRYTRRFFAAVIPKHFLPRMVEVTRYADKTFGRYLIGKIFEAVIVGALYLIVLAICRFPYFALIGMIMMLTNMIPVFGVYIGCIPSALLLCMESPWLALWFLFISFVITQTDGALIGPKVIGNAVGLDGMWIILSITVMGAFFGIPGMIFGAPVFSVLFSIIRTRVNNRLVKKGLPAHAPEYAEVFSADHSVSVRPTRRIAYLILNALHRSPFRQRRKKDSPPPKDDGQGQS